MSEVSILLAREEVEFTDEQLKEWPYGKMEGYRTVSIHQTYFDSEKNYVQKEVVVERISDNKFFKSEFSDWGSGGKEWLSYTFTEVFPKQITTTIYE